MFKILPTRDAMIRVVHQLKGRARFEVSGLRGGVDFAHHLEQELLRLPAIARVSASAFTGRVLVLFSTPETADSVAGLIDTIRTAFGRGRRAGPSRGGNGGPGIGGWLGPQSEDAAFARGRMARGKVRPERIREPWHTMEPEAVARRLESSLSRGLSGGTVAEHRARFGGNALPGTETRSVFKILRNQAGSLPVALIGLAAGLSVLTGAVVEGLVMVGVAALNVAVGTVSEHRAERELQTARVTVDLRTRVIRDGGIEEIPFEEVVMGDVLSLQAGSRIPADGRVIHARSLALDEASLTGESMPVNKAVTVLPDGDIPIVERHNMVFRGTLVVEGTGRAIVVATGQETVLGKLQRFLGEVFPPEALMAQDLRAIAHKIFQVSAGGCAVLAAVSLLRGRGLLSVLGNSIALFAGSIPTGLSTLAISAFALGHRDLRWNRIQVRRLRALGNLASIQVVCLDKTGTLTHNRMMVTELCAGGNRVRVGDGGFTTVEGEPVAERSLDILWLIQLGALCNEVHVEEGKEHKSLEGSATEKSLIRLAERAGLDLEALREEHPFIEIEHRSEGHPFMVTVHRWGETGRLRAVKGSPLEVLERCTHYARFGEVLPLGEDERDAIELDNLKMAGVGLRVLGFAFSRSSGEAAQGDESERPDYVWAGLVGLDDPLRNEAGPLIQALQRAGIRTAVITGDQTFTAQHIGNVLRLSGDAPLRILDASDLRRLDEAGMRSIATQAHVFARLNPTQKLQVVQAYQSAGMSVAMVGDGVNDALALRVADVGIAMGQSGAPLARGSADLVLEDDDLGSVMFAMTTGRAFYRKMRRSVRFLLTANHTDMLLSLLERGAGIGYGPGLMQGLWTNLMCLSLTLDRSGLGCDDGGPVAVEEGLIQPHEMEETFWDATRLMTGASLAGSYGVLRYGPGGEAGRLFMRSASINQLLYGTTCCQRNGDGRPERSANPVFDWILAGAVGGHLAATILPAIGESIGVAASYLLDGLILGAGGLLSLALLHGPRGAGCARVPTSKTARNATLPTG